ncbi:AAA family ATPase [Virgibacillus litoralis]|uniref:ABC-type cobalamin/Fe3+-siderophores transport system ATPase subunit n=1 Tax=Virgibacillus litoralis TaxID=578221 RepID=A0ABS4HEL7_9BACI|nr:ABC-type cobalamin/Fe3+-siderophores transport system ATPase subunit [Virgibacillus litoralis]
MIKFKKIVINGFKDLSRKLELEFSNEMISVVYGGNGSGKTTLLKILHSILSKDEESLLREKVNEINLYFTEDNISKTVNISLEHEFLESNEIEEEKSYYNWSEFDSSSLLDTSSILFGVNRGVPKKLSINDHDVYRFIARSQRFRGVFKDSSMAREFSKDLNRYLRNQDIQNKKSYMYDREMAKFEKKHLLVDNINIETIQHIIFRRYTIAKRISSERVQKALFDTLSFAINPEINSENYDYSINEEDFINQLTNNKDKLLEALANAADNGLRNELLKILQDNNLKEILEYCSKSKLLSNLLYRMIHELKEEEYILESISMLEDIFNSHLSNNKKIVITNDEVYIQLESGRHSLNELSSGERHLLTFLTMFLIEGVNKQFLMIDEPELSLNIKWQREILPLLHRLAPNSQIIVASHSPSIAKKNTNYLVRLI